MDLDALTTLLAGSSDDADIDVLLLMLESEALVDVDATDLEQIESDITSRIAKLQACLSVVRAKRDAL